jgi:hypothetical protein
MGQLRLLIAADSIRFPKKTMPSYSSPFADCPVTMIAAQGGEALDAVDKERVLRALASSAVIVRGFPPGLGSFNAFAKKFCSVAVFNESPNRRLLDEVNNIQSVNLGTEPFPLHPELSREPWRPDLCFFHCITAPGEGGETTFCDGVELVRRMPPALRAVFEGRSLLHVQPAPPAILEYWLGTGEPTDAQLAQPPATCPYRFQRYGDRVVRFYSAPALHHTLLSNETAFGNFLLFARYYLGSDQIPLLDDGSIIPDNVAEAVWHLAEPITFAVPWQAGDILILDNSRFMHGRNAIGDPAGRLIASYFGYLDGLERAPHEIANPPWRKANFRPPVPRQPSPA